MLGFRVWDVKNKLMIDLEDLQKVFEDMGEVVSNPFCLNYKGELCHISAAYYLGNIEKADASYYIPMQSTGLKDMNDKPIFEGDIVIQACHDSNGRDYVFYSAPFIVGDVIDFYAEYFSSYRIAPFKIIGNIYENEELLEKVKC